MSILSIFSQADISYTVNGTDLFPLVDANGENPKSVTQDQLLAPAVKLAGDTMTGALTAPEFVGAFTGNLLGAASLVNINPTNVSSDHHLAFFVVNSGSSSVQVDSAGGILYNPNTNLLQTVQITVTAAPSTVAHLTRKDYVDAGDTAVKAKFANLNTKVIDIGVWDMSAATGVALVNVAHGLDFSKIRFVQVSVFNDSGTVGFDYKAQHNFAENSITQISWNSTNITLYRADLGPFDSTSYNDGVVNRGHIKIEYID